MGSEITLMRLHGLFATPLNNGDWMVGSANCLYRLDIRSDHYADERLAIAPTLLKAIEKYLAKPKVKGEQK
jgi:hypothetical protein